jgi:hypothetical protein
LLPALVQLLARPSRRRRVHVALKSGEHTGSKTSLLALYAHFTVHLVNLAAVMVLSWRNSEFPYFSLLSYFTMLVVAKLSSECYGNKRIKIETNLEAVKI